MQGWEKLASAVRLGVANEEYEAASGGEEAGSGGESGFEALDGAESDHGRLFWKVFGAGGEYIDVRQCKGADDFAEEGGLFLVGFDEGNAEMRRPDLDRKAREAGAGAQVDQVRNIPTLSHRTRRGWGTRRDAGEEGFSEVAGDDFLGVADASEVNPGIPAE